MAPDVSLPKAATTPTNQTALPFMVRDILQVQCSVQSYSTTITVYCGTENITGESILFLSSTVRLTLVVAALVLPTQCHIEHLL